MKFKQVLIVEGKTDSLKLKSIYGDDIETIETDGLNLSKNTLNVISDVNDYRGVIVFTDPDGPGAIIRDKINIYLNYKCFNAFISKKSIKNNKIGIAEADDESIKEALENLIEFDKDASKKISWKEYLDNNWYIKENRIKIAKEFRWSEDINSKKLFQWLNLINIDKHKINKILEK